MRRRPTVLAAVLALGLAVPTAYAVEEEPLPFEPNTPLTEVFMTCSDPSKEYTVGRLANDDGGTSSWSTAKPASVTTGAGCGKAADDGALNGANGEALYDYSIRGEYIGNLDTLTVTVHTADLGQSRPGAPMNLRVRAAVDGVGLFGGEEVTATGTEDKYFLPKFAPVTVTPVATGATGGVRALTFTITGIDLMAEKDDKRHEVFFGIASVTAVDKSDVHNWLWGAAEAPSSVVFTPEEPAAAVLTSIPRDDRK